MLFSDEILPCFMPNGELIPSNRHGDVFKRDLVPALFVDTGEKGWWRFTEFFTARIRNANTRAAYLRAVWQFSAWCDRQRIPLSKVNAVVIAVYIEELTLRRAKPTVKQHLAALKMLFDYLVTGHVLEANPAAAVRGPKHVVTRGLTTNTLAGLRDRALIGVMIYSFARVGAVVAMNLEDYERRGKRMWFRLHEKGGKRHEVPVHHKAEEYLDAYLAAAWVESGPTTPLFRRLRGNGDLQATRLDRREVLAMVKRRALSAGLSPNTCCHSFRATGITAYLLNGGTLEHAQQIAAHESPRTTKLYDRSRDDVSLDEIERIQI
jgi:integrase/recombinase XerD